MEFACLQHLDMIKLRLGFGEFDRSSELLQKQYYSKLKPKNSPESLLGGFSSLIEDAAPLRMIVPPKYILRL